MMPSHLPPELKTDLPSDNTYRLLTPHSLTKTDAMASGSPRGHLVEMNNQLYSTRAAETYNPAKSSHKLADGCHIFAIVSVGDQIQLRIAQASNGFGAHDKLAKRMSNDLAEPEVLAAGALLFGKGNFLGWSDASGHYHEKLANKKNEMILLVEKMLGKFASDEYKQNLAQANSDISGGRDLFIPCMEHGWYEGLTTNSEQVNRIIDARKSLLPQPKHTFSEDKPSPHVTGSMFALSPTASNPLLAATTSEPEWDHDTQAEKLVITITEEDSDVTQAKNTQKPLSLN